MSRKSFITLILSVIGGILFAVGMCMCLIAEWDAFTPGVVMAVIGLVVLAVMVMARRKMDGKPAIVLNGRAIATVAVGVVGALVLGVGMCLVMVWSKIALGIVIGVIGIVILLCLIPLCKKLY